MKRSITTLKLFITVPLTALIIFNSHSGLAQSNPVGIFQNHADIGNPKIKGAASFNAADQSYILKGAGANVWFNRDEFHYAYSKLKGDFIVTANVKLLAGGKHPHRKIGWMIRASEQEDAAHMSATVHADGLTALQWRRMRGAYMRDPEDEIFSVKRNVQIIQLERTGKMFIMRIANPAFAGNWQNRCGRYAR
jgi:hypothetical protein